ncbi:unnamed protein product, partial [Brassica rapa subsp. narinosa]
RNHNYNSLNNVNAPGNDAWSDSDRGSSSFRTRSPGAVLPLSASFGRMTTLVPFPDLNLMPDSPPPETSSNTRITAVRSLAPTLGVERNSLAIFPVPGHENHHARVVQTLHQDNQELARYVFKRTRMIYDSLLLQLTVEYGPNPKPAVNVRASKLMEERGLWLNKGQHLVGPVPGVEIGDIFFYRKELCMYGLHRHSQAGIEYTKARLSSFGVPIATSIIASGGYEDNEDRGDVLVYSGQGGRDKSGQQRQHQKLVRGNLAMVQSMQLGVPVRVIRGFHYKNEVSSNVFIYDGLYRIVKSSRVRKSGFDIFKFTLVRIQGQPEMGSARLMRALTLRNTPLAWMPAGYISFNLYGKNEGVPVYLYNDIDYDRSPLNYGYISQSDISSVIAAQGGNNGGCDCNLSCTDDCICVRKNGGELPYSPYGSLLRGKHVIFECGVTCKCTSGCANRVAQRGLMKKMEVFRTREAGWGVRSLDLIHAGEFICEYAGTVVTKELGEIMSMNGDGLVYPGRFAANWKLWGDLSDVYPGNVPPSYPTIPPVDYAIDVSRVRSVAAFIRHSREPNVMAQFVFHDHNNLKFPRVMLFALENISPLTELSLDYVVVDEVDERLAIRG